jgi:hypothetical protein
MTFLGSSPAAGKHFLPQAQKIRIRVQNSGTDTISAGEKLL